MTTTLTSFSAAQATLSLTGTSPTLTVKGNTQAQTIPSCGYSRSLSFTYGTGATALYVDTMANFVRQIAVSPGTDTLTVSALAGTSTSGTTVAAMTDVLNQATPVFARVRGILLELLTTGDTVGPSDPTPTAATAVVVGNAVSHAWTAIVNGTATFTLLSTETWSKVGRSAAGILVGSGATDQLLLTNSDSVVAVYRGIIFGCGT